MSELLKVYARGLENRGSALAELTCEDKVVTAAYVLSEIEALARKYRIELKRVSKARRAADARVPTGR